MNCSIFCCFPAHRSTDILSSKDHNTQFWSPAPYKSQKSPTVKRWLLNLMSKHWQKDFVDEINPRPGYDLHYVQHPFDGFFYPAMVEWRCKNKILSLLGRHRLFCVSTSDSLKFTMVCKWEEKVKFSVCCYLWLKSLHESQPRAAENNPPHLWPQEWYPWMHSFTDKAPKPEGNCCLSDGVTDKNWTGCKPCSLSLIKRNHVKSEEAKDNCSLIFAIMLLLQWITSKKFKIQA